MGYGPKDKLSIISLNSQRRALQGLPLADRPSYYQALFENAEPDICFLPGDDKQAKLNAIMGYSQYLVPHNDDKVLLYDSQNVEMQEPKISLNALCSDLHGIDLTQMVVPDVTVTTQEPTRRVVKEFNMISWKYDYLQGTNGRVGSLAAIVEMIIEFSQRLGHFTQKPVLIGGELNISYDELNHIVKRVSKKNQETFLSDMQPMMSALGLDIPSMAKSSLRDQRHMFMMNVFKCSSNNRSNGTVKTWETSQGSQVVADCFIASKQLQLADPTLIDVESVIGRKVCMPLLHTHRPTQTYIDTPVRPPRHHGG